ncbi:hypothetical protein HDEF_1195 [Candidatus Hamiltonella defensa 5AT (Acyrthosiphon pisum)]|uniref:Uncharacterized protein n=1 Tax=Hamiltonella defensa subsp. Acyrthosiphon pisum (strain 5AT) TaxID=572265 RepID=C4K5L1_HAMD5|nr:hypothetical protein HDEF_1195 [Candidatus Hamiltonella defensa 5AT (Acyrthosiphon pisum)]
MNSEVKTKWTRRADFLTQMNVITIREKILSKLSLHYQIIFRNDTVRA